MDCPMSLRRIRCKNRTCEAIECWALVESYRRPHGPRQRPVSHPGEADLQDRLGVRAAAEGHPVPPFSVRADVAGLDGSRDSSCSCRALTSIRGYVACPGTVRPTRYAHVVRTHPAESGCEGCLVRPCHSVDRLAVLRCAQRGVDRRRGLLHLGDEVHVCSLAENAEPPGFRGSCGVVDQPESENSRSSAGGGQGFSPPKRKLPISREFCGVDETRTRGLLRDRQAF
jgi:hypothetical protein